jgi:uncharacterized surface protein with fasciclin (FAS1) repeats
MPGQQGTSQDQTVDPGIDRELQTATMGETLANIEECSAFLKLIRDADLEYVLRLSGLRTLLAPRNHAVKNLSSEEAEPFLNQHVLSGAMESSDFRRCHNVKTIAGQVLPVVVGDYADRRRRNRKVRRSVHQRSDTHHRRLVPERA